jgi:DNA-binding transcriptional LysR family regulator
VAVEVVEVPTASLADQLFTGSADLALISLAHIERHPELRWTELWRESLIVLVHPDHRLAARGHVAIAELDGEEIITPGDGSGAGGISPDVEHLLQAARVRPSSSRLVASPSTLAAMVRANLGVGVMSALGVALVGQDGLVALPVLDEHAKRRVVVARLRNLKPSAAVLELEQFISDTDYRDYRLPLISSSPTDATVN